MTAQSLQLPNAVPKLMHITVIPQKMSYEQVAFDFAKEWDNYSNNIKVHDVGTVEAVEQVKKLDVVGRALEAFPAETRKLLMNDVLAYNFKNWQRMRTEGWYQSHLNMNDLSKCRQNYLPTR